MRNKKWKNYQVDGPDYNGATKLVDDLTEAEAKNELCLAMDLIAKLLAITHKNYEDSLEAAKKHRYSL